MKVIGILRVKDEADLLPDVLNNVANGVDEIFAYDDNSTDGTLEILREHPAITHIEPFDPTFKSEVQKTQLLERRVKQRHPFMTQEVWVALLAGDLFWLNKTPREAATYACEHGYDIQNAIAIDFGRWSWDEETDTWPNWTTSLRELCQWCKVIEELPGVWKVADYTRYTRLPWPRHFRNRKTGINLEAPFLEHQGKRSPKFHQWKYASGSRMLPRIGGVRATKEQFEDYAFAYQHGLSLGYWANDQRIPWEGLQTIDRLIELENMSWPDRLAVYRSYDDQRHDSWPRRTDI
jgi:glycosyltransferase involved in cell wall biosynthesis